ncbi:hypothetical protein [Microvirga pakistanensis]|uniref:hypothetical protein n=1 Tax=Microvirga pakistanensis TaxID=1682650 RepID=UPI00106931FB|nr:hypothetical protein [Microvirga pakistanensis]
MNSQLFEAWYDEADESVALTPVSEVRRLRAAGGWLKAPVFLHRIEADTLEEAVETHQQKMDWDTFWAHKDVVQLCRNCGIRYFLKRSNPCPNCGHHPEASAP